MSNKTYKILFFGTPDFAVPILETLLTIPQIDLLAVFTQPDKPVGRKQQLTPPPVKIFAEKNSLVVFQPEKIKTNEFEKQLKELKPDVCIVVAYGKIISKNLLSIPKYGWLNVHASLLPKYRGASPIQSAILNGDDKTGVTLMQIDAGLDTGPLLAKKETAIDPADNFQTLHDKLSALGAELVRESLLKFLSGEIKPQLQDNGLATTTKIIHKEDGRIDWTKPAIQIERQIRAYTPWPGAYCFWPRNHRTEQKELTNSSIEQRLKVIEAVVSPDNKKLPPGQTTFADNTVIVGCGQGNLQLKTIQLEGKKAQQLNDFLKGYPGFKQTQLS
jgi:methionyl-tRNA formyltransferase